MTEGKPKHDRSKWKHEDAAHRTARTHKRRADELAAAKWLGYDSMSTVVKVIVAAHQNVLRNSGSANDTIESSTND